LTLSSLEVEKCQLYSGWVTGNKKADKAGRFIKLKFFADLSGGFFAKGFDLGVQAALMSSGLVFVDYAFISDTVDHWNSYRISGFGGVQIAALYGFYHVLNIGAHHGTQTGVVGSGFVILACALFRLGSIGHCLCS